MRPSPDRIFDYREFPILYVDDEEENLRIFELTFRREFTVVTAAGGEEGMRVLQERPVALVLSDHRMPGMTGVEFLERVHEFDPKSVRILVTAYGDAGTLQKAINNGSIYRFVPKPWSPDEMRTTLRQAIEVYALERERGQLLRELTLLNRISKSINQELALGPLVDLVLDAVCSELGYDGAALLFWDGKSEKLRWSAVRPVESPVNAAVTELEFNDRNSPGLLGELRSGNAQILRLEEALDYGGPVRRWLTEVAAEEILVVPLVGKAGAIGALAVDNRSGGRRFTADDRTLLEGLANQAVIAIQNARLVDDLRRSREQVLRADRLGTLGTLAAGLAHEINNPLVSIHTFLSMAPSKRADDDPEFWCDYHELASREAERIRGLVETMRRLGRGAESDARTEYFDIAEMAGEVVRLVEREAQQAGICFALESEAEVPKIEAIRDQIHQVLLNLLVNAVHATPRGGRVAVRTYRSDRGNEVCLEVADSGEGIPEENLERIFDPFFTTKSPDQGTGLGLMISHRIVADHGGSIEVQSRDGQGAVFCVRLPIKGESG